MCSDRQKQIGSNHDFPRMDCILGKCNLCGTNVLGDWIKEANAQMLHDSKSITWRKWVTRTGKSAPEKLQMRGTVMQAIAELLQMIDGLKAHLFHANWNRNTFEYI